MDIVIPMNRRDVCDQPCTPYHRPDVSMLSLSVYIQRYLCIYRGTSKHILHKYMDYANIPLASVVVFTSRKLKNSVM